MVTINKHNNNFQQLFFINVTGTLTMEFSDWPVFDFLWLDRLNNVGMLWLAEAWRPVTAGNLYFCNSNLIKIDINKFCGIKKSLWNWGCWAPRAQEEGSVVLCLIQVSVWDSALWCCGSMRDKSHKQTVWSSQFAAFTACLVAAASHILHCYKNKLKIFRKGFR